MDSNISFTGFLVFIARICDVSMGAIRTIVTGWRAALQKK